MPFERLPDRVRQEYARLRLLGISRAEACRRVAISETTGQRWDHDVLSEPGAVPAEPDAAPIRSEPNDELAARCLDDFGLFRETYLCHVAKAWMSEAADTVVRLLATPSPEFLVINCPPGAGKSSFLQDLFTWLVVRDRRLRCMYGADTQQNATKATRLIRSYLEAVVPPRANPRLAAIGEAVQSTRTLAQDFGVFKPADRGGLWQADAFTVAYDDGGSQAVKEATVTAYGRAGGTLGNRAECVGWDDLQTEQIHRSPTQQQTLNDDWDGGMAESRVEPTDQGLMFLVGQRIGPRDIYAYNRAKTVTEFVDGKEVDRQMYERIEFPAHFDDICVGVHEHGVARSWPHGCLLDAERLPWYGPKGLKAKKENSPRAYATQYQQQDGSDDDALIHRSWVYGGHDGEGVERPGCLNRRRRLGEKPREWEGHRLVSMATIDPSGTKFWAVQWWLLNHTIGARALMGLIDKRMEANQLLDWTGEKFTGVLEDLHHRSVAAGLPITHYVFEINAFGRHFNTTYAPREWRKVRKVAMLPHTTGRNKNDPDLGLSSLVEPYRAGKVDLPYDDVASRAATDILADQLTGYHDRDDQLMAAWFAELYFHRLDAPRALPNLPRPSWQRRRAS